MITEILVSFHTVFMVVSYSEVQNQANHLGEADTQEYAPDPLIEISPG